MRRKGHRADHCGSLLRPQQLREALMRNLHDQITREELRRIEDESIIEALQLQKEVGLDVFSDGEFRRRSWLSAISDEYFDGMRNEGVDYVRYPYLKEKSVKDVEAFVPPNPIVTGRVQRKKRITAHEIDFLKRHSPGPFKITIPSPVMLSRASYRAGVSDSVYPTWDAFFDDFVGLLADEVRDIAADGVTYIQLDAPFYTRFMIPERRQLLTEQGIDPEAELERTIAAENRCLRAAKKDGVTVAVHICLGTFILGPQGPLGGAGSYDAGMVGKLLETLEADTFLVEYSERIGALESLRLAPKDRTICLGILNVRDTRVESVDEVVDKVVNAAKFVPMENLAISPNCGFSGAAAEAFVTPDIQKWKLDVLVEAARRLWN
jgi:5-methyltetrahydropteroyltriglutamate--homocysteine methyltransferase